MTPPAFRCKLNESFGVRVECPVLPQVAIGALFAVLLLISLPGFARRTLAETLQYSYSAQNAVTYRIPLLGIASDGGQ